MNMGAYSCLGEKRNICFEGSEPCERLDENVCRRRTKNGNVLFPPLLPSLEEKKMACIIEQTF